MKKPTRKGAMTTGKSKEAQAKELKRQMEMRKKHGGSAPMEPISKKKGGAMKKKPVQKKFGGGAAIAAAKGEGVDVKNLGSLGVVGALRKNPDAFKHLGLGGAALSKLLKERGAEMEALENKGKAGAKAGAVKTGMAQPSGMAPAAQMKKKGGVIKKKVDGLATRGKTRGRIC